MTVWSGIAGQRLVEGALALAHAAVADVILRL